MWPKPKYLNPENLDRVSGGVKNLIRSPLAAGQKLSQARVRVSIVKH